jgi:hypothetical protein
VTAVRNTALEALQKAKEVKEALAQE